MSEDSTIKVFDGDPKHEKLVSVKCKCGVNLRITEAEKTDYGVAIVTEPCLHCLVRYYNDGIRDEIKSQERLKPIIEKLQSDQRFRVIK